MAGTWNGAAWRGAMVAGVLALTGAAAQAQQAWVQIEAVPSEAQGLLRAQSYAARLPDVSAYGLGAGWYGIVLGPYPPADAQSVLSQLRSSSAIPSDSFVVDGRQFGTRIFPVGAAPDVLVPESAPEVAPESVPESAPEVVAGPEVVVPPVPDETRAEALASEGLLTRPEKELLQIALQWAGFYTAAIDGSYGRGTRDAMATWQEANGFEPTGVLTTRERGVLLASYNAVLDGMGMERVSDAETGIEIEIPTGVVAFAAYAPPFARFEATGDIPATVLLISQPGDQSRMAGLYEIMQTLEVVPPEGERARRDGGFTIEGANAAIHSYTFVTLENGEIKGFTLVWPAGDEERRTRILQLMQSSFTRIEGVLDPATATPGEEQAVDLVSGLAIRQPIRARSGFYVDGRGTVVTTAEAVEGCGRVLIDDDHLAEVAMTDPALGLAVLRPVDAIAPLATAAFQTAEPRLQSEVAVAGYPYGGLFSSPAMTFGRLADLRGLNGEPDLQRLDLRGQEGDAGAPVLDAGGSVIGMLLPRDESGGQILPADVGFALSAQSITAALSAAGIGYDTTTTLATRTRERLTRDAADLAVLVACWD